MDLLQLINDILDLAKIESGTVTIQPEEVHIKALCDYVDRTLRHLATEKGLDFRIEAGDTVPASLHTDPIRLQQVLRNLIANAIKFTPAGSVTLRISLAPEDWHGHRMLHGHAPAAIAFAVSDTGIGIAPHLQTLIFDAFQQAESGTARKYGGTGGEVALSSTPGVGSTFTFYVPLEYAGAADGTAPRRPPAAAERQPGQPAALPGPGARSVGDDPHAIGADDAVLLIIEDDFAFAGILVELAHEKGIRALVARSGEQGVALASRYRPMAITLDLNLPDMDGWSVLQRLKADPATARIPVEVISVHDDPQRAVELGAVDVLVKPVSRSALDDALGRLQNLVGASLRNLLLIEGNALERESIAALLAGSDLAITEAATGEEALAALQSRPFDCIVLDLLLPDRSGFDLLHDIHSNPATRDIPVIVHTAKDLNTAEQTSLHRGAASVITKDQHSHEHLLAETAHFVHRSMSRLSDEQRKALRWQPDGDRSLSGRKVLIVDDQIRSIFSVAATLENHGAVVISADSGHEALDTLSQHPDIEAVLIDIMMPGMDGYQTTRKIRTQPQFAALPVIAPTARAMKEDRERCLAAGCSDYLPKPVDAERLVSLLRHWLDRRKVFGETRAALQ